MAWVRDGNPPEQIKVSFLVSTKEHAELARFILALPYRSTSKTLRDILSEAVKAAGQPVVSAEKSTITAGTNAVDSGVALRGGETDSGGTPDQGAVSTAAAGIIKRFDKMFPS